MQYHINETQLRCHEELDKVFFQYSCSYKDTMICFFKNDVLKYVIFAFIGFVPTMFMASLNKDVVRLCVSFYYLFLGGFALYEHMKERMFHMEEILELSYLNRGRRFLYKSICLSFVQLMMLMGVFFFYQQDFLEILLMSLLPAYFSQMFAFLFIDKIYSVLSCFIIYILSYISVLMVMNYIVENIQLAYLSPMMVLGSLWLLMMLSICFIYKKERKNAIWN